MKSFKDQGTAAIATAQLKKVRVIKRGFVGQGTAATVKLIRGNSK